MSTFMDGFQQGQNFIDARNRQGAAAEELAMRKTEADQRATDFANRQAVIQRDNDAYQQYGAATSGFANNQPLVDAENAAGGPVQGMAVQKPVSNLDRVSARRDLAIGLRSSPDQLAAIDKDYKDEQWTEGYGKHLSGYKGTDEQIGETSQHVNNTYKGVTLGKADKNGMVPISIVNPDGSATFKLLSKSQQAQVYASGQMMQTHPEKAISILDKIDSSLAAHVAQENGLTEAVGRVNNDASFKSAELTGQSETRSETATHNRADEKLKGQEIAAQKAHYEAMAKVYGNRQQPKLSYTTERDAAGRVTKTPVFSRWNEDTKTMETFPVPKGFDTTGMEEVDPTEAELASQRQSINGKMDGNNYAESSKALANIDAQMLQYRARKDMAKLEPEARLAKIKEMVKGKAAPEDFASVGVTPEEVKVAKVVGGAMQGARASANTGMGAPASPSRTQLGFRLPSGVVYKGVRYPDSDAVQAAQAAGK